MPLSKIRIPTKTLTNISHFKCSLKLLSFVLSLAFICLFQSTFGQEGICQFNFFANKACGDKSFTFVNQEYEPFTLFKWDWTNADSTSEVPPTFKSFEAVGDECWRCQMTVYSGSNFGGQEDIYVGGQTGFEADLNFDVQSVELTCDPDHPDEVEEEELNQERL